MSISRRGILKALGGACAAVGLGKVIGLPEPVKPRVLGLAKPLVGSRASTIWYDDPDNAAFRRAFMETRSGSYCTSNDSLYPNTYRFQIVGAGEGKKNIAIRQEVERG